MPQIGKPLTHSLDFADLLKVGLETKPDGPALVSAEMSWTWRELETASSRYAANLLALGLRPGDRVASLMPNRTALILHYIACLKARLISVPLNYRYMPPEIDHALGVTEASILFHHAERDADVAACKLAASLPLGTFRYAADDDRTPQFEQLLEVEPASPELPEPDPDDSAFVFFTSGSTGKPKGVTHSRRTLGWLIASKAQSMEVTADDILLPGSSISHIGGLMITFSGFSKGARVDVARTFDGDELLPLMRNTRPTFLCMLPAALIILVRDHGATREDFASLRMCISGGDKVSGQLESEFEAKAALQIHEVYGMSEIGLSHGNRPHGRNKIGSMGEALDGFHCEVRDDDGNELPPDQPGRLWVRSKATMTHYWNRPDATAETLVDGWLDTGDWVSVDGDGFAWFHGRKKQIIVHDGSNISPQEIEEVLMEHPAVAAAGVIGVHDQVHGENVYAYITVQDDAAEPTSQDLVRFARERVGYKAPEHVFVLDQMPLNATGKTDRVTLKKMAEEQIHPAP